MLYRSVAARGKKLSFAPTRALYRNREGLSIKVDFSLPSERVMRSLDRIIELGGKPQVIRCDNGQEHISAMTLAWATRCGFASTSSRSDSRNKMSMLSATT